MRGQHLIVHAADPVPPRPDLAVRHREQILAERRAERLEHLLRRIERDAADQHEARCAHLCPSCRLRPLQAIIHCHQAQENAGGMSCRRLRRAFVCCCRLAWLRACRHGARAEPGRAGRSSSIVPTGPGAATDVMARLLSDGVSRALGQTVVVENMPGASGILGAPDRRARGARRLHVPVHQHVGHGDQSRVVQAASLRPAARLHAGRVGVQPGPADAVGQQRAAGEHRARARSPTPKRIAASCRSPSTPPRAPPRSPPSLFNRARRPWLDRGAVSLGCADGAGRRGRRQSR